ncbi:hypothetical protein G7Y79_00025g058160 [Physcia stellaris]|nr:hypothetical protein G7Y79_00025g058160 [Physcia stellaris]
MVLSPSLLCSLIILAPLVSATLPCTGIYSIVASGLSTYAPAQSYCSSHFPVPAATSTVVAPTTSTSTKTVATTTTTKTVATTTSTLTAPAVIQTTTVATSTVTITAFTETDTVVAQAATNLFFSLKAHVHVSICSPDDYLHNGGDTQEANQPYVRLMLLQIQQHTIRGKLVCRQFLHLHRNAKNLDRYQHPIYDDICYRDLDIKRYSYYYNSITLTGSLSATFTTTTTTLSVTTTTVTQTATATAAPRGPSCQNPDGATPGGGGCSSNCFCDSRSQASNSLGVCDNATSCGPACASDNDCAAGQACAKGGYFATCNGGTSCVNYTACSSTFNGKRKKRFARDFMEVVALAKRSQEGAVAKKREGLRK